MSNISCSTIKDILPLYVDQVVSADTHDMVTEHLKICPDCRKLYEQMTSKVAIPMENDAKPLHRFKKAWKMKKIRIAAISVIVTLALVYGAMMAYSNVAAIQDLFNPVIMVTAQNADTAGQWKQLEVGETGYLTFDSKLYDKEVVVDANSDAEVSFRISDQQGNVILDSLTLQPGTGMILDKLEYDTNYIVEIKTSGSTVIIRFL